MWVFFIVLFLAVFVCGFIAGFGWYCAERLFGKLFHHDR